MLFRARQFEFIFPRPALVMGVVNITPDSFSDGGKFLDADAAVAHALELARQGADILDLGGESTRPGAEPVSEEEELRRVIPVIEKLAAEINSPADRQVSPTAPVLISIDTMKPDVARAALQAGASIVNDVAANRREPAMWQIVAEFRAGYVCMHAQGTPQTMQQNPVYADVVREVGDFFRERLEKLQSHGLAPEQVVFDPGIGFGKTPDHNLSLLAGLRSFTKLRRPLLLGVSRKSFLGKISGAEANERLPASLACTMLALADGGAQLIRTHDVAATAQAARMAEAILSRKSDVEIF
jgi:dihydropteroate synthase